MGNNVNFQLRSTRANMGKLHDEEEEEELIILKAARYLSQVGCYSISPFLQANCKSLRVS